MELKLGNGTYILGSTGLPETVSGLDELLQDIRIRLTIPKGGFPYDRDLGSRLKEVEPSKEHAAERALALANEALLDLPGVRAEAAELREGGEIAFTVRTPLGKGEVIYGNL